MRSDRNYYLYNIAMGLQADIAVDSEHQKW